MTEKKEVAGQGKNSKLMVTGIVALLVGSLIGGTGTYFATNSSGDTIETKEVVAKVGDAEITQQDLYNRMVATYGKTSSADLVLRKIVDLEAEKNKTEVSKEDIEKQFETIKEQYGGAEALQAQLDTNGTTEKDLREDIKYYLLMQKLVEPRIDITDKAIKDYFEENKSALGQEEKVEANHILVTNEKTANSIIDKLNDGEDWDKLAKKYSTDTSNASSGGALGYFAYADMDEAFSKAAFAMKTGTYSKKPVKSSFGYHIIKVTGHEKAKEATLEGSKATIKQQLVAQGVSAEGPKWEEEMRTKYKVENSLDKKDEKATEADNTK